MSRPEKKIDWKKVDELLMAGCHGTEVAPHFDMHVNTFYDKVSEKYKISFTEYCLIKRQQGESLLRNKQFEKALSGDNVMLVWLGKNRLKQRENAVEDLSKEESKTDIENKKMELEAKLQMYESKYGKLEVNDIHNKPQAEPELPGVNTPL